jgi:Pyruvate/2-oxoacid:ferredoxin oxidoreductase delta subunit
MPRGDGTGPPGIGGRGLGRGGRRRMGYGRGRGHGQRMRLGRQAGMGDQRRGLLGVLASTPSIRPGTSGPVRQPPVAAEQRLDEIRGREASRPGSGGTPVACIDEAACTPCGACQAVCPTEAITLGEAAVKVNAERCCGCGACVDVCPNGAISLN